MSVVAALVGLGMLGISIYAMVITNGAIMYEIDYFQTVKGIGGSMFAVLIMSFYGGIAGGVIMTIAALLRKRRLRKPEYKTA